ncbi:hypothetical protein [Youngiibacter multivorans]|uniref:Transposase n=1 Tax=Youngiibacter multivorans TaxID=937251 RepID=A0ABS4G793_9CLOT|nr:hypothetical protein [Youngiibacter multivorans]MBP1920430.1 hypothetical protein [Youngiibacter multivorans]
MNKKLRKATWQCNHNYDEKGKVLYQNRNLDEKLLTDAVVKALGTVKIIRNHT